MGDKKFKLVSDYEPKGDQPNAISSLSNRAAKGLQKQVLKGATGTGKTYVIAHVIENVQKPTLVISHNKTLAAQLYGEFKTFFPNNAVEYFVSYYDYYQPEAYIPQTDTYIAKDVSINEEIDRLRHSTTQSLLIRSDVIVIASVSCLYGIGAPTEYLKATFRITKNQSVKRNELLKKLVKMFYERNDLALSRGKFRARGNIVEFCPVNQENVIRIVLSGNKIQEILYLDPVTGVVTEKKESTLIFPARHFVTPPEKLENILDSIEKELDENLRDLNIENKLLEAQRLLQRTKYDIEMIREVGYCTGIENYSRHFDGRKAGEPPNTIIDYFPNDFLTIIDESHVTIPQIQGMFGGDLSRKNMLIDYGFRLPSARDNRPLTFEEFEDKINQIIFMSATPGAYELSKSQQIVEQIIRPTGLVDPEIIVKPVKDQIKDLIEEIKIRIKRNEKTLVTTLTKKMAENLSQYVLDHDIKVHYLHSEIDTLDRVRILKDLRTGVYDVIVGVNLLREGLDLPEVSLVAILDADSEGFLRSDKSLIQTIGRASRNVYGRVIMYADNITGSMKNAIDETNRRRKIQLNYNDEHGIIPETIRKDVREIIANIDSSASSKETKKDRFKAKIKHVPKSELNALIANLEQEMFEFASKLEFEKAAETRDRIRELKRTGA
ncbi:excinuclease ABC subunit B [miscellaneous Crenarchaeota group archaeon SMTZ-80]|nr:MAG: excinuclease ABC subunit B [miscellaneous Crenarchaeota group archaeon SMTZ-80]